MSRPQTLAEVAQIARAHPADFAMALDEFVDEFYLDHSNKPAQQDRLNAVPEPVGDPHIDAWIGAVGEHLAQRWKLDVPPGPGANNILHWSSRYSRPIHPRSEASSLSRAPPLFAPGSCSCVSSLCRGRASRLVSTEPRSRWSGLRSALGAINRPPPKMGRLPP